MKPKYKVNDCLIHKEKKIFMMVSSVQQTEKGNLYALFCPNNEEPFKRYYEQKIDDVCEPLENSEMAAILYGKGKQKRK